MKKYDIGLICLLLAALGGGCVTTEDPAERMRDRTDFLQLQDQLARTEGRLESLEMEYQRLLNEINSLRSNNGEAGTQQRTAQARMDALEQRLAALDAARERDRQAIVDQLTGRIAEVMRTGAPARGAARPAAGGAASNTGYEHAVQPGETLSAIAAAYKVSVKTIIDANNLKDPDHLRQGQKLFIPQ